MTTEEFEAVVQGLQLRQIHTLVTKAKEYASCEDRLHNFKAIARAHDKTAEQVVIDLADKHLISIWDMIESSQQYTSDQWLEKIGDLVNYYGPLLYAVLVDTDRISNK